MTFDMMDVDDELLATAGMSMCIVRRWVRSTRSIEMKTVFSMLHTAERIHLDVAASRGSGIRLLLLLLVVMIIVMFELSCNDFCTVIFREH